MKNSGFLKQYDQYNDSQSSIKIPGQEWRNSVYDKINTCDYNSLVSMVGSFINSETNDSEYKTITTSLLNFTFNNQDSPRSPLTFAIEKYRTAENTKDKENAKKVILGILDFAKYNVEILNYKDGEYLTAFDYADKFEICDIASEIIKRFNDEHNHKYVDFFLGTINGSRHKAMARILCTDYTNGNAIITGDIIKYLRKEGCIYERFIFNLCSIDSDSARSILQNKFFTYKDQNENCSSGEWTFGESIDINKEIDGTTILFKAIETGSDKTVQLLVDSFGAGIIKNVNGVSPIEYALNYQRKDIAGIIFNKNSSNQNLVQEVQQVIPQVVQVENVQNQNQVEEVQQVVQQEVQQVVQQEVQQVIPQVVQVENVQNQNQVEEVQHVQNVQNQNQVEEEEVQHVQNVQNQNQVEEEEVQQDEVQQVIPLVQDVQNQNIVQLNQGQLQIVQNQNQKTTKKKKKNKFQ